MIRSRVESRLEEFLDGVLAETNALSKDIAPIIDQIRVLTMRGGKRVRPALVIASMECLMPWEDLRDAALDVCAAIELFHTYLLIHDDWMDRDTMRRGGPTVHVVLTQQMRDASRGEAAAILAGDLASALAQTLLCTPAIPPDRALSLMQSYTTLQREVMAGQTLDLLHSDDLEVMYDLKTASYTTRGPCALGHALAGGDAASWEGLLAFSKPLGIAFQLRDDLLGSFGDSAETGKKPTSDVRAGKRTALVAYTLRQLGPPDQDEFLSLLGAHDEVKETKARATMARVGAPEAVEAQIVAYRDRALSTLAQAPLRSSGKELLSALAHQLTSRTR